MPSQAGLGGLRCAGQTLRRYCLSQGHRPPMQQQNSSQHELIGNFTLAWYRVQLSSVCTAEVECLFAKADD